MSITPPDPGKAMELARMSSYDAKRGGFVRARDASGEDEIRWLYPEANGWVATCRPERRVSPETFAILHDGRPSRARPGTIVVGEDDENGPHYALVDLGYEASAEAV